VANAITVFKELHAQGINVRPAIRLDSGDLAKLSKTAYRMMVDAGLENPLIIGSNELDEDLIADLKRQGAKINAWGVGTNLITSRDCPALSGVYKLVAVRDNERWKPRIKISSNIAKATDPGCKRVVRYLDAAGHPIGDVLYQADETWAERGLISARHRAQPHVEVHLRDAACSEELLQVVFEKGRRTTASPPVAAIQRRALDQIAALPEELKRLRNPEIYHVLLSHLIGQVKDEMLKGPNLA
jgi:nicotinate phosphoribosyltransferase